MEKTFTITQAERYVLSDYAKGNINKLKKLNEEISLLYPCDAYLTGYLRDKELVIERTAVKLVHPTLEIEVEFSTYRKKYSFRCLTENTFRDIGNTSGIGKDVEKPNDVGVLTAAKIRQWVSYFEQRCKALAAANKANQDKVTAFRAALKGLPVRWMDKNSGQVVRGGFRYRFVIDRGYISEYMELDSYIDKGLERFLLMSDNKLYEREQRNKRAGETA